MDFALFVIMIALLFDFTNGFHDAGNSIATIVATGVLTPLQAVLWAAFFNFIAFIFFKFAVASMIATGLIAPEVMSVSLIFSALVSAILWNIITWYLGLPSSSTHALIGGLAGAAFMAGGFHVLQLSGFAKVLSAIIISPLLGLIVGFGFTQMVNRLVKGVVGGVNHSWFRNSQLISSALLSLTHGSNDAQKTMGIIAAVLYSDAWLGNTFYIPFWVCLSCYAVIALGTLFGGWRIVHTMGKKITHLNSLRGCCAETAAASVIFAATDLGIPVSTTHTVTGSIVGVGLSKRLLGVKWSIVYKILLAWIITVPATAVIAFFIASVVL